ncbi:myoD family inhibitor [Leptodactylus fuscus]
MPAYEETTKTSKKSTKQLIRETKDLEQPDIDTKHYVRLRPYAVNHCKKMLSKVKVIMGEDEIYQLMEYKESLNATSESMESAEPFEISCHSVAPPVTQAPQVTNGTWCNPYPEAISIHKPKTSSKKKVSSQPPLEKQPSQTSNEGSEPLYLPPGAQEDCCVRCTLALLFCQFLSVCNLLLDVLTCGSCSEDSAGFCCSCCSIGACPDCGDSCSTDCGIVDACCESADCLEICMECCGLCFSS